MSNEALSQIVQALNDMAINQGESDNISPIIIAVVSSLITFCLSELIRWYLLESLSEYRRIKAKIVYCLKIYAEDYHDPCQITSASPTLVEQHRQEAQKYTRECAAQIASFASVLPKIHLCVPDADKLKETSDMLFELSSRPIVSCWKEENSYSSDDTDKLIEKIKSSLALGKGQNK